MNKETPNDCDRCSENICKKKASGTCKPEDINICSKKLAKNEELSSSEKLVKVLTIPYCRSCDQLFVCLDRKLSD